MSRNTILTIVAIIVILLLGYWYAKPTAGPAEDAATQTQEEFAASSNEDLNQLDAELESDLDTEFESIDAELETL